jgi:hypothetical protein
VIFEAEFCGSAALRLGRRHRRPIQATIERFLSTPGRTQALLDQAELQDLLLKVQEHLLINSIRSDELRVVRLALPEQLRHVALLLYDAAESLVDPFHAAPEVAGPVVLNFVAGLVVGVHDV